MRLPARQFAIRRTALLVAPALMAVAGCAGGLSNYVANPVNAAFSVTSSAQAMDTNGQVQLKALTTGGTTAAVKWSVLRGENAAALGQGAIDARGVYTPPASLSRDTVEIEIQAQLKSDPTKTATEVLEIAPGFLQPLTPENSALAASGTLPVTAQLAEVGGGTVTWSLATAPNGGRRLGSAYGTFSQEACQRSPQNYTVCNAVYTAPATLPSTRDDVYVVATVSNVAGTTGTHQSLHILLNPEISSTPLTNQTAQTSLVQLGSSGSNNNDADLFQAKTQGQASPSEPSFISDCCGGTLGALVRDQNGDQYILSNNHVIAESDQASPGDAIVQPGLIDRNCDQNAGRPVASLRYVVPLATTQTNVDAALAEVNAGSVDPTGAILQLGIAGAGANGGISSAAPAAGIGQPITPELFTPDSPPLMVAKSGRTTGLTCSTIDAIDLSVEVDYYKDCAETQPYYHKTFANQIGVGGDGFSDSGDSGALVVNASNAEPLGLFFAGGSDDRGGGFSIANPIQDVLAELGSDSGQQFSIVGGAEHPVSCLNYDVASAAVPLVSDVLKKKTESAVRRYGSALVNPAVGILEVAAGASVDSPGDPAILVYVDKTKENVPVPQTIGGIRTVVLPTDEVSLNSGTAPRSATLVPGIHLAAGTLQDAAQIQQANARRLMTDPAVFGVGVTQSHDNPNEAALLVLVDISRAPRSMPASIGGLRTRYVLLHRFHVTRSKHAGSPHPSSCALRSLAAGKQQAFDPEKPTPLNLP
jgi:hypothetical protein